VAKSIAPPIPWTNRAAIRKPAEGASADARDATVKIKIPRIKIFLRPRMSASRPNGTIKSAAETMYAEVIQPSVTASALNCAAMDGRATVMDEPV
jgi:hypothetical protein